MTHHERCVLRRNTMGRHRVAIRGTIDMSEEALQARGHDGSTVSSSARAELGPSSQFNYVRVDDLDREPFEEISKSLLLCGDAQDALTLLPDGSIQTVLTSPPYWSLRDYDVKDQIGRNDSLDAYIQSIVNAFQEIRRVLRKDGTVWLNVGDSYTSGNRTYRAPDRKNRARAMRVRPPTPEGLKPKELIGVPWSYLQNSCAWADCFGLAV